MGHVVETDLAGEANPVTLEAGLTSLKSNVTFAPTRFSFLGCHQRRQENDDK